METLTLNEVSLYRFRPSSGESGHSVLFSHATGIAALSYKDILQRWADDRRVNIFAYDARGHGRNTQTELRTIDQDLKAIPAMLCEDLKKTFLHLKEKFPGKWTLAGHSLGGWLSLYAAPDIGVEHVVLLDMPLLPPTSALIWATACFLQQRAFHPLSQPARRRKKFFKGKKEALLAFKRNPFFKKWDEKHIDNYIDANFEALSDGTLKLRHDPEWEATLFESQPALHTPLFLKMANDVRKQLRIELIAGSDSRICDPSAIRYFYRFFPRTRWIVVPDGGHMFPFENTVGLMRALALTFPKECVLFSDDVELKAV